MDAARTVRIGGACAGYGDGTMATPQLIRDGAIDYVILDYLSEVFMPTAARTRQQDPNAGYVMYFPDELYSMVARDLVEKKVKLVTNVGAVNPRACAAAMPRTSRHAVSSNCPHPASCTP